MRTTTKTAALAIAAGAIAITAAAAARRRRAPTAGSLLKTSQPPHTSHDDWQPGMVSPR